MRTLLLLVLLTLPDPGYSQAPKLRFDQLTTADGLPDNSGFSLLQDRLGFIWVGTQNGLTRYDGTEMTVYRYEEHNPYSLKARLITTLLEDRNGDIWIGGEGLYRFERSTHRFYDHTPTGAESPTEPGPWVWCLHQDRQGQIWAICMNYKQQHLVLNRLDPKTGRWTFYRHTGQHSSGLTHSAIYDQGFETLRELYGLEEDRQGNIWVITTDKNKPGSTSVLHRHNRAQDRFDIFRPQPSGSTPATLAQPSALRADSLGNLWVGTLGNGLFQVNTRTGKIIAHYHQKSAPKQRLTADTVLALYKDKTGSLWVTTSRGLDELNFTTGQIIHYQPEPTNPHTPSGLVLVPLQEMPNGDMWFVSPKGLDCFVRRHHHFIQYQNNPTTPNGLLLGGGVYSFLVDRAGLVWIGTWGEGVLKQKHRPIFTRYTRDTTLKNTFSDKIIRFVYEAPSEPGILWIGTGKGLDRWNKKTGVITHFQHEPDKLSSLGKGQVTSIVEDAQKRLWIGTWGGGLCLLNRQTNTFTRFTNDIPKPAGLSSLYISSVLADQEGTLWIGTYQGVNCFDPDQGRVVKTLYKADTTHHPALLRLLDSLTASAQPPAAILRPDSGPAKTLSFTWPKKGAVLVMAMGQPTSSTRRCYGWIEDSKGRVIWQMSHSRSRYAGGAPDNRLQVESLSLPAGNYRLCYWSAQPNPSGNWPFPPPDRPAWWGIQLLPLSPAQHRQLEPLTRKWHLDGLREDNILNLMEHPKGAIWIGTNNGGVSRYQPKTNVLNTYFDYTKGPNSIAALEKDTSGQIWVGDYHSGLLKLAPRQGVVQHYKAGLPSPSVHTIQRDSQGRLWVSTHNGICRFDPATGSLRSFNPAQGFPDIRFYRRSTKGPDGTLYFFFGGSEGFIAFHPDAIQPDSVRLNVVLTDLDIFNTPASIGPQQPLQAHISQADQVTLAYDQNDLTFRFTTPYFTGAAQVQYVYRLEGYDQNWTAPSTMRQARYTDLSPGTYTFQVKAANADGVWNEQPTSIKVVVYPPWWQTWWAYLLYGIVLVSSLRGYVHFRSRTLRRQNRLLEEQVRQRTSQIEHQKEEILAQKEEIQTQRDHLENALTELKDTQNHLIQKEKMASLGELTAGIAHEIQNPLNFVTNFAEVSVEMIDELKEKVRAGRPSDVLPLADYLSENLQTITEQGQRAAAIIRSMLDHAGTPSGEKQPTDLNALADEYLRLAYYGMRAKDQGFTADLRLNLDQALQPISVTPQDMGRVLLNLYNNAFYAVQQKQQQQPDYQPQIDVTTQVEKGKVELRVKDNGTGIPPEIINKIYQPFFTTKPTGEGRGLGLSLSYDIVTKGHGGEMRVETEPCTGTEFIVILPYSTTDSAALG
ncbi:sensor histidine kinase [Nibrella viscosa]|uniref:histidine kinase n=1 Tax=Nibrella viscosa TaxID=1084524 RepID=A0ABP8KF92_9BACT